MFWNGSTAMEGLSGQSGRGLRSPGDETTIAQKHVGFVSRIHRISVYWVLEVLDG